MKKPVVKRIHRQSVTSQVYEQLKHNILTGIWKTGEKIPSENELVKMLGVSRIVVREAFKQLISLGLLEARQGEGTFVKKLEADLYMNQLLPLLVLNREEIIELIKYREIIETGAIALAAERADEADIRALEENLRQFEICKGDHEKAVQLDLDFHRLIAEASKNPFIIKANSIIKDIFQAVMEKIIERMGTGSALYYHKKMLEALKAKDKEMAVAMMHENLVKTEEAMT